MINIFQTLISTFKLQVKQSFARPTYKFCIFVQPIAYSVIIYMMFKNSGQNNFIPFVVLGTGILTLWSCVCYSSAGDIERERFMGTLKVIYCTPTDFKLILLGKILGNTILGLLPFGVSFVVVRYVFNGEIYIEAPIAFVISMFVTIISFVGISFIFSAFFTLSRGSRILMNCVEYPAFILCGMLFPIEILPVWIRPLSYILSPTWAVKILRMSVAGIDNMGVFVKYIFILTILSTVYFLVSYVLFNLIDKKVRTNASLEVS